MCDHLLYKRTSRPGSAGPTFPKPPLPMTVEKMNLLLSESRSADCTFFLGLDARGADAAPHNCGYIGVRIVIKSSLLQALMKTHGLPLQSPLLAGARELPPSSKRRGLAFQVGHYPDLRAIVLKKKQAKTPIRPITKLANSKASSSFRVSTNIRETRNPLDVRPRFADLHMNSASASEERTVPAKLAQLGPAPTPVCFLNRPGRVKSLQTFDSLEKDSAPTPKLRTGMGLRSRLQDSLGRSGPQDHPILGSLPQLSSRSWVRRS